MSYLILFIITAVASTHWIRFSQKRGCRMMWVGALTYITATACTALWIARARSPIHTATVTLGLGAGVALGVTYLFFNATIRRQGVGIAHFIRQLALAIPILASILIWGERVTLLCGAGVALAFAAFALISKPTKIQPHDRAGWPLILPAGLFAFAGGTNLLLKAYSAHNLSGGQPPFLLFLFAAAGAAVTLAALRTRQWPDRRDIVYGAILGLDNVLLNYFRVRALETELGVLAFPTMSIGVILLSAATAFILWKERFRGRVLAGMAVALAALILINLGR